MDIAASQPTFQIPRAERPARTVLHEFLESKRAEIIARTKAKVAARPAPRATEAELTHGVPLFLEQLMDTLKRSALPSDDMTASATKHGNEMLRLHVCIDIEDECGGLSPGKAEMLFRPFQQGSTDRSGLGLGLSISRKAVQLHGGDILVRNLPGKGCVFTVQLPRTRGANA